jgi:polysaccharide biosynthesis transport protein
MLSGLMSTPMNLRSDDSEGLSLRDALRVVARWKWLIIGLTLGLGIVAFGYSSLQPKQYTATTSLKYEQQVNVADPLGTSYVSPITVDQELASVSSQLSDPALKAQVARSVGLPAADPQLAPTTVAVANSSVVTISATAKTPAHAAAIANGYAAAFIDTARRAAQKQLGVAETVVRQKLKSYTSAASQRSTAYVLLTQQLQDLEIAAATATGNYTVVSPAVPPTAPSSPHPKRTAAIGLAAGLLLGIALAFLLEQLNTSLRSHREVSEILDLPVVGRVPRIEKNAMAADPLAVVHDPGGSAAEALRLLRSNLDYLNVDGTLSSVLVTSCIRGEGKSVTVCNLAATLALGGKDVVVVDGDLRRPRVHTYFGLPNAAGLSTVVSRKTTLAEALQTYELPLSDWQAGGNGAQASGNGRKPGSNGSQPANVDRRGSLRVLTSGPLPPNPGELIASETFGQTIAELVAQSDIVLVDTPAFIPVSDAAAIAPRVDGVFMLVNMDGTTRPMLTEAKEFLAQLPARKLGVIVVREKTARHDYYRYHSYDADPAKA